LCDLKASAVGEFLFHGHPPVKKMIDFADNVFAQAEFLKEK